MTTAERMLQDVLERNPLDSRARTELRWLYFHEFRVRDVERLLEEALQREPHDLETLTHLILSEFRGPVPQEGLGRLQMIEARQPGQLCVLRALAHCHAHLGHTEEARQSLNAALAQSPDDVETLLIAGEFCIARGDAAAAAKTAARLNAALSDGTATDDRIWSLSAEVARLQGDTHTALECSDHALQRRPFELRYHQRRGLLLKSLGREEESSAALRRAQELADCQMRLTELAWSGALQDPTADECAEVASLCAIRGKSLQTEGWQYWAAVLQQTGPSQR